LHRRVHEVGQEAALPQQLARPPRLRLAGGREADVHPAGEQPQRVPLALTVAEQQERGHGTPATASIMVENSSAFRLAPPTRQPAQLASPTYEATLAALTLPP